MKLGLLGVSDRREPLSDTDTYGTENVAHRCFVIVGVLSGEEIPPIIDCGARGDGTHCAVGLSECEFRGHRVSRCSSGRGLSSRTLGKRGGNYTRALKWVPKCRICNSEVQAGFLATSVLKHSCEKLYFT